MNEPTDTQTSREPQQPSRPVAALRRFLAYRALRRALAAKSRCCGGRCTTADDARALARLAPIPFPRQRTPKES